MRLKGSRKLWFAKMVEVDGHLLESINKCSPLGKAVFMFLSKLNWICFFESALQVLGRKKNGDFYAGFTFVDSFFLLTARKTFSTGVVTQKSVTLKLYQVPRPDKFRLKTSFK